jgi:hypothetical protein
MKWAVLAVFLLVPSAARASEFLTSDLRKQCEAPDEAQQGYCVMYLLGMVHGLGLAEEVKKVGPVCTPDDISMEELRLAYIRWLKREITAFPGDIKLPAGGVLAAILHEAFPCPAK